jgi:hypothetical protein
MAGQQWEPRWWQAPDGKWYPVDAQSRELQQNAPPYALRQPAGPSEEKPERDSRSRKFREWVQTAQGLTSIAVSLIAIAGAATAFATHVIGPNPRPSPTPSVIRPASPSLSPTSTPSPVGLTVDAVQGALLTSSDLTGIDSNLGANDIQPTNSSTCPNLTVDSTIAGLRQFIDKSSGLVIVEGIDVYKSSSDAQTALEESASSLTCSITPPHSTSNISNQINGLCSGAVAYEVQYINQQGADVAQYMGIARCGRAILTLAVATTSDSYNASTLVQAMEIAVPKVQGLP